MSESAKIAAAVAILALLAVAAGLERRADYLRERAIAAAAEKP